MPVNLDLRLAVSIHSIVWVVQIWVCISLKMFCKCPHFFTGLSLFVVSILEHIGLVVVVLMYIFREIDLLM